MRTLELTIEAGEKTCYSRKGVHCHLIETTMFGQIQHCCVWPKYDAFGKPTPLLEAEHGWLQRWPECMEADRGVLR